MSKMTYSEFEEKWKNVEKRLANRTTTVAVPAAKTISKPQAQVDVTSSHKVRTEPIRKSDIIPPAVSVGG